MIENGTQVRTLALSSNHSLTEFFFSLDRPELADLTANRYAKTLYGFSPNHSDRYLLRSPSEKVDKIKVVDLS